MQQTSSSRHDSMSTKKGTQPKKRASTASSVTSHQAHLDRTASTLRLSPGQLVVMVRTQEEMNKPNLEERKHVLMRKQIKYEG